MVVKLNRETKLHCSNNLVKSKNWKPFWDKRRPYFSNKHVDSDSKKILIERKKLQQIQMRLLKKKLC